MSNSVGRGEITFVRSSFSGGGNCVEVARPPGEPVKMRNSRDHVDGPVLTFTGTGWAAFVAGVKAGDFDQI